MGVVARSWRQLVCSRVGRACSVNVLASFTTMTNSIFAFSAKTIDGEVVSLEKYRAIKWNFSKFLVDREGKPVQRYSPQTDPLAIEKDIVALLEK
ncbi:uncharacterized protein DEA37_0009429 [Paragonimus westermani]|uniref:Glutathione peroxidase n=1 Tax=Paragonimus westermani TaxID=34504 RepID=A0A5J4N9S9_9TREM|nr:uncharacterized protein DEA37_0009429 [Paragonimus westermani]